MLPVHRLSILWVCLLSLGTNGFHLTPHCRPNKVVLRSTSQGSDNEALLTVKSFLKENYPGLNLILEKNDSVWKALAGVEKGGFTIFAPNAAALATLGEGKQKQLSDPRNLETTQKVGAYHVIAETVSAEALFNSGGVITLGGEIPIDRSRTGGFLGVGGKEDGGVTINGAKVVKTTDLGNGLVHEVDALVSPSILWRYMDQLRIPGSR